MIKLRISKVDIVVLAKQITDPFHELAETEGINFTVESLNEPLLLWIDVEKISSAIRNLLSNAFKYTSPNGKVIFKMNRIEIDGYSFCSIIISDTGKGIPEELRGRIFESFITGENTPLFSNKVGIGLRIVKNTMDLHHGTVNLDSTLGKGSTFTLLIPEGNAHFAEDRYEIVGAPEMEEYALPLPVMQAEGQEDKPSNKKTSLLVIEDNEEIRHYVCSLFCKDYAVYEAANGEEGVDVAMSKIPDLIISDVMMPGIDGIECCRRLKSELQTCHIPVILLTACSLDEQRIQGYDGGADSYISKPFSSQLLLARVRNLIDSHRRLKQFFGDRHTLAKEDVCDMDKNFVEKFKSLLDAKLGDSNLNVEDLGKDMGLSRVQLYRKIKSLTNYSPNELLRIARLKKAASLLASSDMTVAEIGYEVGFSSPSYFTKCYKEQFGESPTDFLKRRG